MRTSTATLISTLALSALGHAQMATPPGLIPFEARIVDPAGDPVQAQGLSAHIAFYDVATGGSALATQDLLVDVVDGHFSALLGVENDPSFEALFEGEANVWLGLTLGTDNEMLPRLRMGSSPYAYRAASADDATGDIHPSSVSVGGQMVIDANGQWVGDSSGFGGAWQTGVNGISYSGSIGIQTADPLGAVHIGTADLGMTADALQDDELIIEAYDAILGLYSAPNGAWGSGVHLGEIDPSGELVDKWAMMRNTPTGGSRLRFTYGTDEDGPDNPAIMTLTPEGRVGIGVVDPSDSKLMVVAADDDPALYVINHGATSEAALFEGRASFGWRNYDPIFGPGILRETVVVEPDESGAANLDLYNQLTRTVELDAADSDGGGKLNLMNASGNTTIELDADQSGAGAGPYIYLNDTAGSRRLYLTGEFEGPDGGAAMSMKSSNGYVTFRAHADEDNGANIDLYSGATRTIEIDAKDQHGAGRINVMNASGATSLYLDGGDAAGKSRVVTDILEIRGGADIVEGFEADESYEPGTVMVIDPSDPGRLRASRESYDQKVAGVVSGAGGVDAGLMLGQSGVLEGDVPVALTGRVWVKASAENGAIQAGDLLTTATTPGHAMRSSDRERANGAVLGKAMSTLDSGTGLVLVLVNLQ